MVTRKISLSTNNLKIVAKEIIKIKTNVIYAKGFFSNISREMTK